MKIRFSARAAEDLTATIAYYDETELELGRRFRDDFDAALDRIEMFPNGAPPVDGFPGLRRARMRRFPFGIFYRPGFEESLVIRIIHSSRDQLIALGGSDPDATAGRRRR